MQLRASDLHAGYGAGDVLRAVGVEVDTGEIVGVVGRNGVGKSTLMKCLIGLLPIRSGRIQFNGVISAPSPPTGARDAASATCPRAGKSSRT